MSTKKKKVDTSGMHLRLTSEMAAWLEEHAQDQGYNSAQELIREILREFRNEVLTGTAKRQKKTA